MLILGLDKGFNDELLKLTQSVCDLLERVALPEYDSDVLKINKLQILKRSRNLNEDEVSSLLNIKERRHDDYKFQTCIAILMGSIEVPVLLKKMDDDDITMLKTWPIWNLYAPSV